LFKANSYGETHSSQRRELKYRFLRIAYEIEIKGKVKCTLVQALRLCTNRTAYRKSRGIAVLFHDHGTRRGWGVSFTLRPLFTSWKDPVLIVQQVGWAPGPVWTGTENLDPTGIRTVQPVASRYTDWAIRPLMRLKWIPVYFSFSKF
jgi:hypothetical protein